MTTTEPRGHTPTLAACFIHFDVSFMLWVLLGALGVFIAEGIGLGPSQKALVVAIPILSGSLLRVPLGLLSDRFGGKKVGTIMLACLYGPLTLGWLGRLSREQLEFVELMVKNRGNINGVAGELKIAYNTARSRLDDIVAALGYSAPPEENGRADRRAVLDRLAAKEISVEDAMKLLRG